MKFSILICHLDNPERRASLQRLLASLYPQCLNKAVEVCIEADDGTMTVGEKRNKLLKQAAGEYIAFIDDDDEVTDDYVDRILLALEKKPDCVGIEGRLLDGKAEFIFSHSIEYSGWYNVGTVFYRTPNHLNPVRRDLALRIGFEPRSFGEDRLYSDALRRWLKTEKYISKPIYIYHCEEKPKVVVKC